ncbi:MAG TPA: family 1 glycosylhydrolase [Ktedonobacteraceae bacterium]|nr:family 1 glycosylhydrolase [Ktedonobacteraceae bacterium]
MELRFPAHFYWGTATAAHQVEGGNVYNDNWVLEHTPGTVYRESSGDACDHYRRYREDIALLASLGLKVYRFSLEWSRIEPEEGEFSRAQLEHYRRVLATCHEYQMTPMVTFHHLTSPRWLAAAGGWESEETPEKFARYCERAIAYLGDLLPLACTLNEINLGPLLRSLGVELDPRAAWFAEAARRVGSTPERFRPFLYADTRRGREVMLTAHRRAVEVLKAGPHRREVGVTLAMTDIQAAPGGEEQAARARHELQDVYLEALREDDFVGVQTYTRQIFGPDGLQPPSTDAERTLVGDEFYPEALAGTLRYAHHVTGRPVFVTENGVATANDERRRVYIERALRGVAACLQEGIEVRGYIYWSALDNFEWMSGYGPTFGLLAVNRATQERTVKPSARWLGEVARANGF